MGRRQRRAAIFLDSYASHINHGIFDTTPVHILQVILGITSADPGTTYEAPAIAA
jgi:hypothetical protein